MGKIVAYIVDIDGQQYIDITSERQREIVGNFNKVILVNEHFFMPLNEWCSRMLHIEVLKAKVQNKQIKLYIDIDTRISIEKFKEALKNIGYDLHSISSCLTDSGYIFCIHGIKTEL